MSTTRAGGVPSTRVGTQQGGVIRGDARFSLYRTRTVYVCAPQEGSDSNEATLTWCVTIVCVDVETDNTIREAIASARKNNHTRERTATVLSISAKKTKKEAAAYLELRFALLVRSREVDVGVRDAVGRAEVPCRGLSPVELVLQRLLKKCSLNSIATLSCQ